MIKEIISLFKKVKTKYVILPGEARAWAGDGLAGAAAGLQRTAGSGVGDSPPLGLDSLSSALCGNSVYSYGYLFELFLRT